MIKRFLLLNGLAIASAVLYHASGWGFIAMFFWTDRYLPVTTPNFDQLGSASYYALRVVEQLIIFAVPAFLVVCGFFVAFATGRNRPNVPWKLIFSRVRSLAVPYLLWSVLILTVAALEGNIYSPARYLRIILTGRTASPYYFIPLLIQLYLLSPIVLVPLARKNWKSLLVVSAVIQLAVRTLIYLDTLNSLPPAFQTFMPLTASWFFPGHLFWFAAGIVMGFNLEPFKEALPRLKWRLLTIAAVLFPLGIVEWELILRAAPQPWIASRETLLDSVYAAVVILTFLAFSDFSVPAASQVSDWGSKSFGIYLAHSPILEYSARIIYAAAPWILAYQFLFQPILIILGLGVPLLMMHLTALQKSPVRPFYQHIFGQ